MRPQDQSQGSGPPRRLVEPARGGQVIAGRGTGLADHHGAGLQPLFQRPQRVALAARLDQDEPGRIEPPLRQGWRVGATEILAGAHGPPDPEHGAFPACRRQMSGHQPGLHGQRRRRVEIAGRADLVQARRQLQRVGTDPCCIARGHGLRGFGGRCGGVCLPQVQGPYLTAQLGKLLPPVRV